MQPLSPFHLAIPVHHIPECRAFYRNVIGCTEGRSDTHWVDFNFFGHQLVIHYSPEKPQLHYNPVDDHAVPVPHFGIVLPWEDWHLLAERLKKHEVEFIIEPYIRFKGKKGEQATMFFHDPAGNALEFKAFKDLSNLFEPN